MSHASCSDHAVVTQCYVYTVKVAALVADVYGQPTSHTCHLPAWRRDYYMPYNLWPGGSRSSRRLHVVVTQCYGYETQPSVAALVASRLRLVIVAFSVVLPARRRHDSRGRHSERPRRESVVRRVQRRTIFSSAVLPTATALNSISLSVSTLNLNVLNLFA